MKNNYIILIAGISAAGKTRFADFLTSEMKLPLIVKDRVKKSIWDSEFYDAQEDWRCDCLAVDVSLYFAEELMKTNVPFIFESNFSPITADMVNEIAKKHSYHALTVLLDADIEILHKRVIERDNMKPDDYYSNLERFKEGTEGFADICVGDRVTVDTADFSKVNYDDIAKQIYEWIKNC